MSHHTVNLHYIAVVVKKKYCRTKKKNIKHLIQKKIVMQILVIFLTQIFTIKSFQKLARLKLVLKIVFNQHI